MFPAQYETGRANNRMQSDFGKRCALPSATDAKR